MPQGENYSCFHWGPFKCVSNEYCTYYPTRLRPGLDLSSVSKDLRLTRTSLSASVSTLTSNYLSFSTSTSTLT